MNVYFKIIAQTSIFLLLVNIMACGGGSSNANINSNSFELNVFEAEEKFKNKCQSPRTGIDPTNGKAFADQPGQTIDENFWLRSWSNRTYLWYNEIIDKNPENLSTIDYFDLLKTNELTLSGTPKDKFHFTVNTHEYSLSQTGVSVGYGAKWKIIQSFAPRKLIIAYVEPQSPATSLNVNLSRGLELLEVDGVDFINANDQMSVETINNGLFPENLGESHTFKFRTLNNEIKTVTLSAETITSDPVLLADTLDVPNNTDSDKVGYILFNTHNAISEKRLYDTFSQFSQQNISDIILDLRYNGGGYLAIASQLSYMIAGNVATSGKFFEATTFNDKYSNTDPITGEPLTPTPFYNQSLSFSSLAPGLSLPTLNLQRVFILTTDNTCSASEAIINGLLGIDVEVILIGSTTCGKPYGFYATDNCGTSYFTIQFKGVNYKGFGDYADGFSPINTLGTLGTAVTGCSVKDDFTHSLGDQNEGLLQAALNYRKTQTCPQSSGKAIQPKRFSTSEKTEASGSLSIETGEKPYFNNKILGLPTAKN